MVVVLSVVEVGLRVEYLLVNEFLVLFESLLDHCLLHRRQIRVRLLGFFFEVRQEVRPHINQRLDNHFDVALLVYERIASSSVIELGNCVAQFLFNVSLLVVFLHLQSHPLEVHCARLARVTVVRSVNTHVQDHLLVLRDVLRKLFRLNSTFERSNQLEILRDVCR